MHLTNSKTHIKAATLNLKLQVTYQMILDNSEFHFVTGWHGGLTISFEIDQQEWTNGPFMSYQGMVVSIHNSSKETVILADEGLSVPVGKSVGFLLLRSTYEQLVRNINATHRSV